MPVDPVPAPTSFLEGASRRALAVLSDHRSRNELIDQWRDTTAKRVSRSEDLPLAEPPIVALSARRAGVAVRVTLSAPDVASVRWESGALNDDAHDALSLEPDERTALWRPLDPDDQLRVAVRTAGGVTIAAIRACEVA
jgi:hypothetical protein